MSQTKQYSCSICQWPSEDRPRERLFKYGEHRLSDSELLAILLRTGVKGHSAVDLARSILRQFKTFRAMGKASMDQWPQFKGLGKAKIAQIRAAIEIGRRFKEEKVREDKPQIGSSQDVAAILMPRMRDLKREVVKVMLLDGQNRLIEILEVEEGTVNFAHPIVREIFHQALEKFATSIICLHNHPSGNPKPSQDDKSFTKQLVLAGKVLQVNVLDHIIIGNDTYYSFEDHGQMEG